MPMLGWNGPQNVSEGGVCSCCGKHADSLTMVDDETAVCDDCLENHYVRCDECGEYYSDDGSVEMYDVDGMTVCEYCYEDMEDDE